MARVLVVLLFVVAGPSLCFAQMSGNVAFRDAGYGQLVGRASAVQRERAKRVMTKEELPPTGNSMFIEASVLMNVKADEYVAVFAVAQEGETVVECNQKMDATVAEFTAALKQLGIGPEDIYVDFVAQHKIYGYEIAGNIAKQKLVGFELKKNVAIHFQDLSLFDKLTIAASQLKIFDLVKVDYVVKDVAAVHNRLAEEAARVIKQKTARYEQLLGIKFQPLAQIYAEKANTYFPTDMYDDYTAYESETIDYAHYRERYTVQNLRKSKTFFFNALSADGFDQVINPVVIEPVVQFTLYLKVKYEIGEKPLAAP
jgi:uncharacterized protein YggE